MDSNDCDIIYLLIFLKKGVEICCVQHGEVKLYFITLKNTKAVFSALPREP